MLVIVNKEDLVFHRKLEDQATLSKLANIELPDKHVAIMHASDPSGWSTFTDMEIKQLLLNSGAGDHSNVFSRPRLVALAVATAESVPADTNVKAFEVDMQHRAIALDDERPYRYVPGALRPVLAEGLAEWAALQCAGGPLKAPASVPAHVPQPQAQGSAPQAANARPAVEPSGDFVQPKPGTSTHDIFTFCAHAWSETGFTTDEKVLADIRKRAVDHLVPKGLNVSTVRTQAMRWYHNRQRFAG